MGFSSHGYYPNFATHPVLPNMLNRSHLTHTQAPTHAQTRDQCDASLQDTLWGGFTENRLRPLMAP